MQCQVLFHTEGSKTIQSKGFSGIDEANEWLNGEGKGRSNHVQNARVVVDYAAVEAFQEMYNLMRDQVFGPKSKLTEEKKDDLKDKK